MAEWLSIIGIGEDGLDGLPPSHLAALQKASVVFGGPRHLAMVDHADKRPWPVPFDIAPVLALRGQRVAVLASGDPFWHGAGGSLAAVLQPSEWRAYPMPSVVSLAAARLGWRLEEVASLGLHAAYLTRLRRELAPGRRMIVTLRDGETVAELAKMLEILGFGETKLHILERLGGPHERHRVEVAQGFELLDIADLVVVAFEAEGTGPVLPHCSGIDDGFFTHDGQITKRPIRALALSALAPRPGELLWDLGTGSGSVAIEWLLAHPSTRAIGIERDRARASRARGNAVQLGVDRLEIREGAALELVPTLPAPDAVFVGGGASEELFTALWLHLPVGARVVAHAVTLETEALLTHWHGRKGGNLLRVELAEAGPLGSKRGWAHARPIVQWSVTR